MNLQKYEDYLNQPNLFVEDAEDSGTAAGHRCIEGTTRVHIFFKGGDGGMVREDGGLEVVDDKAAPLPYRLLDRFAEVLRRSRRCLGLLAGRSAFLDFPDSNEIRHPDGMCGRMGRMRSRPGRACGKRGHMRNRLDGSYRKGAYA